MQILKSKELSKHFYNEFQCYYDFEPISKVKIIDSRE